MAAYTVRRFNTCVYDPVLALRLPYYPVIPAWDTRIYLRAAYPALTLGICVPGEC